MKRFMLCILFATWMVSFNVYAEETETSSNRPKVGLVLSGGGAKGSAHIGVLKVLEEVGIPVDYIAGTSMGSIIGGMYSLGYSADELDSIIKSIDWSVYMSNNVIRRQSSYEDKVRSNKYLLNVPFNTPSALEDKVENVFINSIPSGFLSGDNFLNLFNSLSVGYQDSIDFNNLPIPFAAVATDMVTGDEVVFRSGKLATAMRSSMSIPGVFSPVYLENMVLIDGGMKNNFPVDICKQMGADIIIGVRVSYTLEDDAKNLKSLPGILSQLMAVVTKGDSEKHIKDCDIFIAPDIKGFGALSFDKRSIETLLVRGYNAANAQREELVKLKQYLNTFGSSEQIYRHPAGYNIENDTVKIISVSMTGVDEKEAEWLLKRSKILDIGDNMTGSDIDKAVSLLYGTGAFSSITYTVAKEPDSENEYILNISFKKAEPHSFGLGFRFDSYEAAAVLLKVGFNEHRLRGVKFTADTRLSYNPTASALFSVGYRTFPKFSLYYKFAKEEMKMMNYGAPNVSEFYYRHHIKAYFSEFHSRYLGSELGLEYENYDFRDSSDGNYLGLYGKILFDNLDKKNFPVRGVKFDVHGSWKFHNFDNPDDFSRFGDIKLRFESYIPVFKERLAIIPQVYARALIGDNNYLGYYNVMGGTEAGRYFEQQLPFIGSTNPKWMYDVTAVLRLDLRVRVYGKHYVSTMFNYAREGVDFGQFFSSKIMNFTSDGFASVYNWWGGGIRYAYDSPIGPISLDLNWSSLTKSIGFYFNLGYYF